MAAIFAAIAFSGFFMTYWLPVARGTFAGSPMLHLHGLLFSLWTLFFLSQAVLVAIAPVVGSARVTAAAGAIVRGVLGAEALAAQSVPEQRTS